MKTLIACLLLLIGSVAFAEPKQADLSDKQLTTLRHAINIWCHENLDDPEQIQFIGFWDATAHEKYHKYLNLKVRLRVTNSQGVKKLYRFNFIINPDTGHIEDGKAF